MQVIKIQKHRHNVTVTNILEVEWIVPDGVNTDRPILNVHDAKVLTHPQMACERNEKKKWWRTKNEIKKKNGRADDDRDELKVEHLHLVWVSSFIMQS